MGKKKSKPGGGGGGGGGGADDAVDRPSPEDAVRDETLEQLERRHREEMAAVREVTAKFGKKEKDKALRMEGDVSDRHYAEMAAWEELDEARNPSVPKPTTEPAPDSNGDDDDGDDAAKKKSSAPSPPVRAMAEASVTDSGDGDGDGDDGDGSSGGPIMTKAMKRRLKKEAEEKEREARIEKEKANMGPSSREHEEAALRRLLAPLRLRIKEIKADGHCMYRSVEDQLSQKPCIGGGGAREGGDGGEGAAPGEDDYASLRRRCAQVMRKNQGDYRPFLPECAEDSPAADSAWDKYCAEVENSATWGGQMELGALAKAVRRCIKVYSAHMPVVVMGEEFASDGGGAPLVVCYQQHAFGLGEHYNSVVDA